MTGNISLSIAGSTKENGMTVWIVITTPTIMPCSTVWAAIVIPRRAMNTEVSRAMHMRVTPASGVTPEEINKEYAYGSVN
jgi:hypothetical protein